MAGSSGATPGAMTPVTPAGSTADSEKNTEFQENEKILSQDFLSIDQITDLLKEADIYGIQEKMGVFLNFKNLQTCLRDAILLDYYVSGFFWAKEMDFSLDQCSKFMTLLDMLLHNLQTLHMSLEDSIKWLGEVMAEIGPNRSLKNEGLQVFDVKEANAIIDYLKNSLFQHYRLYEFMFYSTREEIVIGTAVTIVLAVHDKPALEHEMLGTTFAMETMLRAAVFTHQSIDTVQTIEVVKPADHPFPAPLEEGISLDIFAAFIEPSPIPESERKALYQEESPLDAQAESEAAEVDPLVGFTIDDVKSALARVTDEVLLNIQNEIKEKLQVQEEAFNARIEKLKRPEDSEQVK